MRQHAPGATGPGRRFRGNVLPLLEAIYASFDPQELCTRYLEAIPGWIPASAHGFYVFNERTGEPRQIRAIGVSDGFLQRYEDTCRTRDPLLRSMWSRPAPRSTDADVPAREWRRHVMAELFASEGHYRYMLAPLLANGRLVGTLNFARRPDQPPFGPRDLEAADLAARHVSRSVSCGAALEQAHKQARNLEQALERVPLPVAVTAHQQEPYLNRAARQLLTELGGGADHEVLADLTAGVDRGRRRVAHRPPDRAQGTAAVGMRSLLLSADDQAQLHLLWSAADPPRWSAAAALLSPRERELLDLLSQGKQNSELARSLGISINTVKQHLKRLFHKLGVRNRAEAVTRALGTSALPGGGTVPALPSSRS